MTYHAVIAAIFAPTSPALSIQELLSFKRRFNFQSLNKVTMNQTPDTDLSSAKDSVSRIFASPPEPVFNDNCGISSFQLQYSLKLLTEDNKALMKKVRSTEMDLLINSPRCVMFIFNLAHKFGLSPEAQYNALDLFSKFLPLHVKELYQHVANSSFGEDSISWKQVEKRLQHQVVLRAVSCIQVASKLCSHYNMVTLNKACKLLSSLGFRYAPSSLVQSEIRVLRTLGYSVSNTTPMVFIEPLLENIGKNEYKGISTNHLYGVCLKITEVIYLERELVFQKLRETCKMLKDSEEAIALENNLMFLAAAVISTSSFFLNPSQSDDIAAQVSSFTNILIEDVLDFSSVVIEVILTPTPSTLSDMETVDTDENC